MLNPNAIRIFSVIAFAVLFLMGIKRPVYAVGAYMVLVYCKLSNYYPVFEAMKSELVFALIILLRLAVTPQFTKYVSIKNDSLNKYLLYFVLCVCLSFAIAWDHQYSWDHAVYLFIKVLILYVMIMAAVESVQDLKIFTFIFMAMMAYLAYEPFYHFIRGTGGSQHLYGTNYIAQIGLLAGHVALANNMNQMIPIAFFLMFSTTNKISKLIYTGFLAVFTIALVGSGSRGGVVGFLFFIFVIMVISWKNNKKIVYIALTIAVIFVISSTAFLHTISRVSSDSAEGRFIGLTHGIGMLMKGNLIGVGPGCYLLARRRYFSFYMESHNIYGQILGDLGIPGTIAWLFFMRQIFRNLLPMVKKKAIGEAQGEKYLKYLATGLLASLAVRLFISMGSHGLYFFYWYVIAAMSSKVVLLTQSQNIGTPPRNGDHTQYPSQAIPKKAGYR